MGRSDTEKTRATSLAARIEARRTAIGLLALAGLLFLADVRSASAETMAPPAACKDLQAKYPDLKGKVLIDALNPHTPGYEALDPNDPSKYIGFDIDLSETMGACLGFTVTYKPVVFAARSRP